MCIRDRIYTDHPQYLPDKRITRSHTLINNRDKTSEELIGLNLDTDAINDFEEEELRLQPPKSTIIQKDTDKTLPTIAE